jgi:hypothetical protein
VVLQQRLQRLAVAGGRDAAQHLIGGRRRRLPHLAAVLRLLRLLRALALPLPLLLLLRLQAEEGELPGDGVLPLQGGPLAALLSRRGGEQGRRLPGRGRRAAGEGARGGADHLPARVLGPGEAGSIQSMVRHVRAMQAGRNRRST